MIQFEIDNSMEGIEIYLNATGIDALISYLNFIKVNKNHIHLLAGNELAENVHNSNMQVNHVKLVFIE